MQRIYLDNAATSWPKPETVYDAVDRYQRQLGVAAGRGVYRSAIEVQRILERAREQLAQLIGAESPERVVWCYSGTDALSQAIRGWVRPGDHVITTEAEHNSVLRPLRFLAEQADVQVDYAPVDRQGQVTVAAIKKLLRHDTRLVALIHASNVTGVLQPVEQVGQLLADSPACFLVDAAQTVGHVPLDVQQLKCDLLAAPGHKGLLGPTGTGFLYLRPGQERGLTPLRMGGTGTQSDQDRQPEELPYRYEAGNLNVPGLMGLGQGIQYVLEHGALAIHERIERVAEQLSAALRTINGIRVHGRDDPSIKTTGVVSITADRYEPQELAMLLDQVGGVEVRAGFHCAPRIHPALGTHDRGGTVRFSCGPFTTASDIEQAISTLYSLFK